jgi:hypothetical protein
MKITTEPRSDQWNAEDFIGGSRTFTIAGVKVGSAEQKYDIELEEGGGRSWRPPLTVLRLLVAGWGDDATTWAGHRVRLYRDPSITFGRDKVGGIRLSHMSHIDKPVQENLTVSRGHRAQHVVEPLIEDDASRIADLKAEWYSADAERRKAIEEQVAALTPVDPDADYIAAVTGDES